MDPKDEKWCKACDVIKPLDSFYNHPQTGDGKESECRSCKEKRRLLREQTHPEVKARRLVRNREIMRKWRLDNPERWAEYQKSRKRKRTINSRIALTLRSRINAALKGEFKHGRTFEILGCSVMDFKIYLESLWESDMSWENYGRTGWHIDHIIPCALFDLSNPSHQKRCFHFSNMQPMWAADNIRKHAKLGDGQFKLL